MEDIDCTICIEGIKAKDDIHITECGHKFHKACFQSIVDFNLKNRKNVLCPNCNRLLIDNSNIVYIGGFSHSIGQGNDLGINQNVNQGNIEHVQSLQHDKKKYTKFIIIGFFSVISIYAATNLIHLIN